MLIVCHRCFLAIPLLAALTALAAGQVPARNDLYGEPLPAGAIAWLGAQLYHHPGAYSLALSPDGTLLATVGRDETRVWETATAKELHRFAATGLSPAFSADNRRLFLGGAEQATVWDIATGKELWRTVGQYAAFTPDGKLLATVHYEPVERSYTLRLVDADGKEVRSLGASPVMPQGLTFTGDGALLAGGCTDGFIRLWDTANGTEVRRLQGHRGPVASVVFAPGGRQLLSASTDGSVRLWDTANGAEVRQWREPDEALLPSFGRRPNVMASFAADGKTLYTAWRNGTVCRVFDPATGAEIRHVRTASANLGGQACASGRFASLLTDSFGRSVSLVRVWDLDAGRELGPVRPPRELTSIAFAADSRTVATGCGDKVVYLWDARTGKPLRQLVGHVAEVRAVAFAPQGNLLASGSTYLDTSVNVWNAATGAKVAQLPGMPNGIDRLAFAGPGTVVAGCRSGLVRRIDVASGKEIGRYQVPGNVFGLASDGQFLAHGYRDRQTGKMEQHVIDLTTGQAVRKIPLPADGGIFWSALTPDGTRLVSYGSINRAFGPARAHLFDLYDTATGKLLRQFGDEMKELDTAYQPNWLVFSPDSRTIAEAQRARTVRLWEVSTGKLRRRLEGHASQATGGAFSPDGRLLATTGADRVGLVWDIYDVSAGPLQLDAARLAALWTELGADDAARGFSAVSTLTRGGEASLAMLKDRLKPAVAPNAPLVARLIADLDAKEFADRQKAEAELDRLGELVVAPLRTALADGKPPLELKKRMEALLDRLEGFQLSPDRLRQLRALEAVEVIGTSAARDVIQGLAGGVPEARLTQAARASLDRLARRAAAP